LPIVSVIEVDLVFSAPPSMKVCPQCSFSNEERFPTCVYCNTLIVDVPSTLTDDSARPDPDQEALIERRKIHGRQLRTAAAFYVGIITFTALFPGFVFQPLVLLLYCLSSLLVVEAVRRRIAGQILASVMQGFMSVALLILFGPFQPLIFFMLISHIVLPAVFWHWTDLIDGAHR
jgi:hypothetical protein